MKAIIMAGGEGKRLKAVSGDTPKPLTPLCGRPVMEHILLLLKKHGITEVCAALAYRPDDIKAYFKNGERFGVSMQYRVEDKALGTAGSVKNCADFYGDEDFLVISGDCACDLMLTELISAHEKRRPAVSIALYPHAEPLSYGLCLCDGAGCVRSFVEKPDWGRVVTNLVNTGIYIISPRAMESVPEGEFFDFAKDLFPRLLEKGETLLGCPLDGYWCDIGTPQSYYQCCVDALSGRLSLDFAGGFEHKAEEAPEEDAKNSGGSSCEVVCRDRARLMDRISSVFLDMGAEYDDGFTLHSEGCTLRIAALPHSAALRICAEAYDSETARELAVSAEALVKELENRME